MGVNPYGQPDRKISAFIDDFLKDFGCKVDVIMSSTNVNLVDFYFEMRTLHPLFFTSLHERSLLNKNMHSLV